MQDADLFLELAGIAGVFVGFGALIAVRSSGPSEPREVSPMRALVSLGMMTIITALAPVTLDRYGLAGHQLWALSSAVVLVGLFVMFASMARTPEYRAAWAAELEADRVARSRWLVVVESAALALVTIPTLLAPVVIILGVAPEQEEAFYFTIAVLFLLAAAWTLLGLVFTERRPVSA